MNAAMPNVTTMLALVLTIGVLTGGTRAQVTQTNPQGNQKELTEQRSLADRGDARGQFSLGQIRNGVRGVPRDHEQAVAIAKKKKGDYA